MKKRYIGGVIIGVLLVGGAVATYTLTPTVHQGTPTELPELARAGDYAIGTRLETFDLPKRPVIDATSTITGSADLAPRNLLVRVWYPADATEGSAAQDAAVYEHDISRKPDEPLFVRFQGAAITDAKPLAGRTFPLVVMSHGYGGWAEHFSFLGEHIASRGYVVASINHADARPDGAMSFLLSFGNVLQNRALDQRQVIDRLIELSVAGDGGYGAVIDAQKIGLIGYSMGGYGALATAGAVYDYSGEGLSNLPEASKAAMQEGSEQPVAISAMVALAPWGGAPDNRSWTSEGLRALKVPTLLIAGNQDDVVGFEDGVQWLFDELKAAERKLLVFREARHNIAGNAITDPAFAANQDFATAEYIREPVWRSERINAINQHFIAAFLDLHLKDDATMSSYLQPPSVDSNDSRWTLSFGEQLNGKLAGADETDHWRGFQRRWALGMELHSRAQGE